MAAANVAIGGTGDGSLYVALAWTTSVRLGWRLAARASQRRASLACFATPEPRSYERDRPETTVLYLVVREHLEPLLATVREERCKDLPRYVEQELRRYLRCGLLCHGFCRVVCQACRKTIRVAALRGSSDQNC